MTSLTNGQPDAVFVYGMLLDSEQRGSITRLGFPATLDGYRLHFSGGLATIREAPGHTMHGAVLVIDERALLNLDRMEGCFGGDGDPARGLYRRIRVTAECPHDSIEAWVYIQNPEYDRGYEESQPPSSGSYYLEMIARGYQEWGLPLADLTAAIG